MKLFSESEIAKQNIVLIEKRIDMLVEQKRKENIPPIHPDPVDQTLEIGNIEKVSLEANTDPSSVLKHESKVNLTL